MHHLMYAQFLAWFLRLDYTTSEMGKYPLDLSGGCRILVDFRSLNKTVTFPFAGDASV